MTSKTRTIKIQLNEDDEIVVKKLIYKLTMNRLDTYNLFIVGLYNL